MIKKVLSYTLLVATFVWSVGLLATPLAVGAATSGDLVKKASSPAVYYLGADNKLHVFTSSDVYFSWYSSFSGVKVISDTEFNSYGFGENVFPRPGVKLVQAVDGETPWNIVDPKVYAVSGDGVLRHITSASAAASIFGSNWESQIIPVVISVFTQYTVGAAINAASDYDKQAEMSNAPTINEVKGFGGGVSTGSSLTVALASDTPATNFVLGNSINNPFTKVNMTAAADGDIVIDSMTVTRGGQIAQDAPFNGIVILDSMMQRTEEPKTLNSQHMAVFNKDITIPAGTTKTFYIAGNMVFSLASYAGQIPVLSLSGITLKGNAAVNGTLPITGNYMQLDGTITIGTLTLSNGVNNPSASNQKVGQTNYVVSSVKLSANGTEDFKVSSIAFENNGTSSSGDFANLELLVDNVQVASVASISGDRVVFDLSAAPVLIEKGKNKNFDLRLDIVDGSSRNISFDVEDESDITARGQLYGANVKVAAGTGATADASPFWNAPDTTIATGSLRVTPATLVSANIAEDSDQVTLGKFEFEAKGEPIVITRLPIHFTVATTSVRTVAANDLTNVTVYDANGAIVAGPLDPTLTYNGMTADGSSVLGATSTNTITVPAGTHVYTVKGDLDSDWAANDTIVARIAPGQITAKGETTNQTVTATPATDQTSATMTVKTAALAISVSSLPIAQNVVAGAQNYTFANVVLDAANSGEDIKITQIRVSVKPTSGTRAADLSNFTILDGATALAVTNDPDSALSTTAATNSTSTFTFTNPLIITRGTVKTLTVKANVSSSAASGTVSVGFNDATDGISAVGKDSGTDAAITLSASNGQAQTIQSAGTLTITKDSSTPDASNLPAETDNVTLAVFNAFAQYEDVSIEKIYFTAAAVNSGGLDQVDALYLYEGNNLVKTIVPTTTDTSSATFLVDVTNSPISVAKETTKLLTIKAKTSGADYQNGSKGASGQGLTISINAAGDVTAKGQQSGDSITAGVTGATGNSMYLFASVPVITPNDQLGSAGVSSATLITGDVALYRVKVAANSAGDIGIEKLNFLISTTTATVTDIGLYEGGTKVATAIASTAGSGDHAGGTQVFSLVLTTDGAAPGPTSVTFFPNRAIVSAGSSKTYELRGTITCSTGCSGSSGSGSVTIQLLGDGDAQSTIPASASLPNTTTKTTGVYISDIQWTDFWRTPNLKNASGTSTTTEQWSNGYLVKDSTGNNLSATSTSVIFAK